MSEDGPSPRGIQRQDSIVLSPLMTHSSTFKTTTAPAARAEKSLKNARPAEQVGSHAAAAKEDRIEMDDYIQLTPIMRPVKCSSGVIAENEVVATSDDTPRAALDGTASPPIPNTPPFGTITTPPVSAAEADRVMFNGEPVVFVQGGTADDDSYTGRLDSLGAIYASQPDDDHEVESKHELSSQTAGQPQSYNSTFAGAHVSSGLDQLARLALEIPSQEIRDALGPAPTSSSSSPMPSTPTPTPTGLRTPTRKRPNVHLRKLHSSKSNRDFEAASPDRQRRGSSIESLKMEGDEGDEPETPTKVEVEGETSKNELDMLASVAAEQMCSQSGKGREVPLSPRLAVDAREELQGGSFSHGTHASRHSGIEEEKTICYTMEVDQENAHMSEPTKDDKRGILEGLKW